MTKNSLKDKLEGDELDLSMMSLTEIPVKEIAALPRASKIDLSNNQLTSVPAALAQTLPNITQLELGSNKISQLPDNFYKLQNLKHLDLYNNQLTELPLSFHQLRSLKWLDLKGNPLNAPLRKVAGDCLNQKECEAAARNVLAHLKKLQQQMDIEKQEKLRKEKEKEEARARQEEAKQARKRAERKAAKEKKKAEQRALYESQKPEVNGSASTEQQFSAMPKPPSPKHKPKNVAQSNAWSCLAWINMMLFGVLLGALGTGLYIYTDGDLTPSGILQAVPRITENAGVLVQEATETLHPDNLTLMAWTVGRVVRESASSLWYTVEEYTGDLSTYTEPIVENVSFGWQWLREHVVWCYGWLADNVDWNGILEAGKQGALFLYEQFLVACEELSKNQALMSVVTSVRTYTGEAVQQVGAGISLAVEQVQTKGPAILEAIQEQTTSAIHTLKQSIEGLVK